MSHVSKSNSYYGDMTLVPVSRTKLIIHNLKISTFIIIMAEASAVPIILFLGLCLLCFLFSARCGIKGPQCCHQGAVPDNKEM